MVETSSFVELACREARRIIPGVDEIRTQVLAQVENKAIAIAEPLVDNRMLSPLQVLILAIDDQWVVWQTGAYEGWLEVEGRTGVVVRSFRADPDATAVRFSDQVSKTLEIGKERRAHAVLWSVPPDGPWPWPAVEEIQFSDGVRGPVSPQLPVTAHHLITEYISELLGEGGWAWDAIADLVDEYPRLALDTIVRAAHEAHDEDVISRIGAGHLESLVSRHGDVVDEELSSAAASSAGVRLALRAVWAPLPPRTAAVARRSAT